MAARARSWKELPPVSLGTARQRDTYHSADTRALSLSLQLPQRSGAAAAGAAPSLAHPSIKSSIFGWRQEVSERPTGFGRTGWLACFPPPARQSAPSWRRASYTGPTLALALPARRRQCNHASASGGCIAASRWRCRSSSNSSRRRFGRNAAAAWPTRSARPNCPVNAIQLAGKPQSSWRPPDDGFSQ